MSERLTYAIGQQDFKMLRDGGSVYVDKTQYIRRIEESRQQYMFLARPRRFGKSLFLSTLRYFFEGRRELFQGLYVDTCDWKWDWAQYPVLMVDLNSDRYAKAENLEYVMDTLLSEWEEKYGVMEKSPVLSQRFRNVIKYAHEKTGLPVVILVDEYDKPLVSNIHNPELFEDLRAQLASIYSNFKSSAEHIKLVFLTGVSRFSKLSIFSDLNNLRDISFVNEYADICGITHEEMLEYMSPGVEKLAEGTGTDLEGACLLLKRNYDGYHFSASGSDIYNPWSMLNALDDRQIKSYWSQTGMPTIIAELLKDMDADIRDVLDAYATESKLSGMDLLNPDLTALMYQTGYLTIKDYDPISTEYHLGIPNREVRQALFDFLVPYYVKVRGKSSQRVVGDIVRGFRNGNPEAAMQAIRIYFAGIDYSLKIDDENNFHNAFFLLMDLIGLQTKAESHTSDGRIDILVETDKYLYIIELKYDHSAEEALRQIDEKHYALPYHADGRRIFKIGASFSSETRRVDSWIIAEG